MKKSMFLVIMVLLLSGCSSQIKEDNFESSIETTETEKTRGENGEEALEEQKSEGITEEKPQEFEPIVTEYQDVVEAIKQGNFSCLSENEYLNKAEAERIYQNQQSAGNMEWVQTDINDDGYDDLIWQENNTAFGGIKRIVGLFKGMSDCMECCIWDVNDSTEFYFWSDTEKLIYYRQYNGIYTYKEYEYYTFNKEWNQESAYVLAVYGIYDEAEMEAIGWHEKHPDMVEKGIYYRKYEKDSLQEISQGINLTEEEFEREYKALTGQQFEGLEQ